MSNPVAPIARAIAEGFKLIREIRETAHIRRMRKAIEAAEKYIQLHTHSAPFDYEMRADKRQAKMDAYAKRFFKLNQG